MTFQEFTDQAIEKAQETSLENYRRLNHIAKKGEIVFTGSSLMEYWPLNEMLMSMGIEAKIYNRGIGGFETGQMLQHMDEMIFDLEPRKIFINIGSNDIGHGKSPELWENYPVILNQIHERLPECKVYVMAYYPCNHLDDFGLTDEERERRFKTRSPQALALANARVEQIALEAGCQFINVNDGIGDERGVLKKEYCRDGVHMYADGYIPVLNNLLPFIMEA